MVKGLKIRVMPADNLGCGHYRMIWPTDQLIKEADKHGHEITLAMPESRDLQAKVNASTGTLLDVEIPECDILVMQRVTHRYLAQAIPVFRDRGITVVIDMDDDLGSIYPKNPAFTAMHPLNANKRTHTGQFASDHSWEFAEQACNAASLVTLSAPALQRQYAKHGRSVVLKNCLPERVFSIEHEDNDLIGYPGAIHSHANDIPVVGSAIARIMSLKRADRTPFRFATVADTKGIKQSLKLPREPDHDFGPVGVEEWWSFIAKLGVGIAPLADTVFNQSKSWLKPLEMSAVRVPCVISPRTEYKRINSLGVGILAANPKEWYQHVLRLAKYPAERIDRAAQAYEAVKPYTFENRASLWLDAWLRAYELDQQDRGRPGQPEQD